MFCEAPLHVQHTVTRYCHDVLVVWSQYGASTFYSSDAIVMDKNTQQFVFTVLSAGRGPRPWPSWPTHRQTT